MAADAAGAVAAGALWPIAALLAVVAFVAFNANGREIASYDSQPTKFLAVEIAKRQTLSLGHVVGRVPELGNRSGVCAGTCGGTTDRRTRCRPHSSRELRRGSCRPFTLVDLDAPLAASFVAKVTASLLTALTVACAFLAAAARLRAGRRRCWRSASGSGPTCGPG